MFKYILQFKLKILAQLVLAKYKPFIVAITGSMGKTSTKEAVFTVLSAKFSDGEVRRNIKNYNNEIGLPLAILGMETGGASLWKWIRVFFKALFMILFKADYPKILVLEMGADRPGDIKYLTSFVKPDIAIITGIGQIPVHVEFFRDSAQVAREKAILAGALKEDGWLILNFDDEAVRRIRPKDGVKVLTYGFQDGANLQAIGLDTANVIKEDWVNFKIDYEKKLVPIRLKNIIGRHQLYAYLAAVCSGIIFDMNLVEVFEALQSFQSPPGRMKLLAGIKDSYIIDDTYNASPTATLEALDALKTIKLEKGAKRIAVLGDMLELGQFTERAHRLVGKKAMENADLIFTVGPRAKFIAEEAIKRGFDKNSVFEFEISDEAGAPVQNKISQGDLVLVKGSQSIRMEKVVEEIMAEPLKAKELLVRQGEDWKKTTS